MLFIYFVTFERLISVTLVERIKKLADEHHTSFAEIERKVDISNGQIRRWDNSSPKVENIKKVADYFNVSIDYLLGREISEQEERELTIQEALDSVMSYDGKPLTDNDREVLKRITEAYLDGKI